MKNHKSILKIDWEHFTTHILIEKSLAKKLVAPYCSQEIKKLHLLPEGRANTNYKIEFQNRSPLVLRIYSREKEALQREIALHNLLANKIPVPKILYSNDCCKLIKHSYAILEFIEGDLMRNIVLSENEQNIADCSFSAGIYLNHLRSIRFHQSGFFTDKLDIKPFAPEEEYINFAKSHLGSDTAKDILGTEFIKRLHTFLQNNQCFLPDKDESNLTHADFDPSNILVKKVKNHYQVSAILDWEFSFAGSYLFDVGAFLRYSHKLPTIYKEKFIEGITSEGNPLPKHWEKSAKLLDLISLLTFLTRRPKNERPNLCRDILLLIQHTLDHWETFGHD